MHDQQHRHIVGLGQLGQRGEEPAHVGIAVAVGGAEIGRERVNHDQHRPEPGHRLLQGSQIAVQRDRPLAIGIADRAQQIHAGGVAAVVTMVSVGRGADAAVQQQIKSLGNNLLMVVPGATTAAVESSRTGAMNR